MTQEKAVAQRQKRIYARLTAEEYADLQEQADVAALSLSEYVRRRVFARRVVSKLDLTEDEKLAMSDTVAIKRKSEPFWGM